MSQPVIIQARQTPLLFLTVVGILFSWSFLCALFLNFALPLLIGDSTFIYPFRMLVYSEKHPLPYLIALSGSFSVLGAIWLRFFAPLGKPPGLIATLVFSGISLLIFSIIGALLWTWHDILAGYMPSSQVLQRNIISNLKMAPLVMAFIAAFSVPVSSLALAISACIFFVTGAAAQRITLGNALKDSIWKMGKKLLILYAIGVAIQLTGQITYLYSVEQEAIWGIIVFILIRGLIGLIYLFALMLISLPYLIYFQRSIYPDGDLTPRTDLSLSSHAPTTDITNTNQTGMP